MAKVTGVGGVFFKSRDPEALRRWYRDRMGVDVQPWGGAQFLFNHRDRPGIGYTVWNPFETDTKYFEPSDKPFMLDRREDGENGKFGYVMDPEGNLLELWEQSDDDPYVPKD